MALPDFSMRQLLEAGVHFGHQAHRWNPKMEKFIFGVRSNIHIIDLSQTVPLLHQALVKAQETAASGGRVVRNSPRDRQVRRRSLARRQVGRRYRPTARPLVADRPEA